ncbi:MAG: S8 family serine peptidase [Pseudomonadota bacterium]|nr:S8 family serine peptidase [Pseudomonadota bacterium]
MLVFVHAVALAAPLAPDAREEPWGDARLAGGLREAARLDAEGHVDTFRFARVEPPPEEGISVTVESEDPEALLEALEARGLAVEAAAADRVQVFVPYARLREVAALPGVRRVREPWRAEPKARISEGYAAAMESDWQAEGYDGAGVRIGIVDVGFDRYDAIGADELPQAPITDFSRGSVEATTHGTAVTEIVYDFAPGATFYLATFSTEVEFGEVLAWLVEQEVDVINASIGFDNTAHADGYSYVTRLVEDVVDQGIIYVAASGNENDKYRVGALGWAPGGGVSLAGSSETHLWSYAGYVRVSLRWSEPFGAAATDLDLVLLNEDGSECGRSSDPQDGDDDPFESITAVDCSELVTATIVAGDPAVDPIGLEGYLYAPDTIEAAEWTNTEDLTLPGDTRGGISVGALYADDSVPTYASRGPTNDGRTKPDVVARTGVSTATYGRGAFEGTSAAAPHVAGLAALWVDASNRRDQPEVFRTWLYAHARDLGPPGPDDTYGAGAARADALPPTACGCASGTASGPGWGAALGLLVALASVRRRA